jgi:hypothetical protein
MARKSEYCPLGALDKAFDALTISTIGPVVEVEPGKFGFPAPFSNCPCSSAFARSLAGQLAAFNGLKIVAESNKLLPRQWHYMFGAVLSSSFCGKSRHQRDEELMLQHCRLLAIADSLMQFGC